LPSSTATTASNLELEAARVKYVVDSDHGGRAIAAVLRDGGVNADDIFYLRDGDEEGLMIEDFIDGETYRLAVNEELRRSGHAFALERADVPDLGRVDALRAWCEARQIPEPQKVRVAARVVELRQDRPLVARGRRAALRSLYSSLRRSLGIDGAVATGRQT
jgi:hypothetical protein